MRDLDSALRVAESDLEQAKDAARRIPDLELEVRGLRLALARQNGHSPTGDAVGEAPADDDLDDGDWNWPEMTRPDAVWMLLRETDAPLSPADIVAGLQARGRPNEEVKYVSAALSVLKNRGRVERIGYGLWVAI